MLLCCHQTNKRQSPAGMKSEEKQTKSSPNQTVNSPTTAMQESHIYEDPDGEDEVPELPDREYLTDIDFVTQEFNLILCRPPDLPERSGDDIDLENVTDSRSEKICEQVDTSKLDSESLSIQELSWKTTALARPNKYNITVPNKHVNNSQSHGQVTAFQKSIQHGQILSTSPWPVTVVKTKKRYQTDATMVNKVPFNHNICSSHQQPVTSMQPQKSSHTPSSHRQLPYRQIPPVNSGSETSQMPCENVERPTYQNVTAESTQTAQIAAIYQNVTGDQQKSLKDEERYQNDQSKQQLVSEGTYQPLLFGYSIDEDEYMDFDRF